MDLRHTDTNAADDSKGRAFGLDGDLYLPVVIAGVVALALFAVIGLLLKVSWTIASGVAGTPLSAILAWAIGLKNGKPPANDRDTIEQWLCGGDFGRNGAKQRGIVEP